MDSCGGQERGRRSRASGTISGGVEVIVGLWGRMSGCGPGDHHHGCNAPTPRRAGPRLRPDAGATPTAGVVRRQGGLERWGSWAGARPAAVRRWLRGGGNRPGTGTICGAVDNINRIDEDYSCIGRGPTPARHRWHSNDQRDQRPPRTGSRAARRGAGSRHVTWSHRVSLLTRQARLRSGAELS